jgi:hypothetical protein
MSDPRDVIYAPFYSAFVKYSKKDDLRILVTGGPPSLGGGGIQQRIRASSRSPPSLCTMGAG